MFIKNTSPSDVNMGDDQFDPLERTLTIRAEMSDRMGRRMQELKDGSVIPLIPSQMFDIYRKTREENHKKQSDILERYGAFFAFSQSQFKEKANPDIEYVQIEGWSGLIAPKAVVSEFYDSLTDVIKQNINDLRTRVGDEGIIRYEANNHEYLYSGDLDGLKEIARSYGISDEITETVAKKILGEQRSIDQSYAEMKNDVDRKYLTASDFSPEIEVLNSDKNRRQAARAALASAQGYDGPYGDDSYTFLTSAKVGDEIVIRQMGLMKPFLESSAKEQITALQADVKEYHKVSPKEMIMEFTHVFHRGACIAYFDGKDFRNEKGNVSTLEQCRINQFGPGVRPNGEQSVIRKFMDLISSTPALMTKLNDALHDLHQQQFQEFDWALRESDLGLALHDLLSGNVHITELTDPNLSYVYHKVLHTTLETLPECKPLMQDYLRECDRANMTSPHFEPKKYRVDDLPSLDMSLSESLDANRQNDVHYSSPRR